MVSVWKEQQIDLYDTEVAVFDVYRILRALFLRLVSSLFVVNLGYVE